MPDAQPRNIQQGRPDDGYKPLQLIGVIVLALLGFAVFFLSFLLAPLAILVLFYIGFSAADRNQRAKSKGHAPPRSRFPRIRPPCRSRRSPRHRSAARPRPRRGRPGSRFPLPLPARAPTCSRPIRRPPAESAVPAGSRTMCVTPRRAVVWPLASGDGPLLASSCLLQDVFP